MNNVYKLEYIQYIAFQIIITPSVIHIKCVCKRALSSVPAMLQGNRNNSKTARSVLHHSYLFGSVKKKILWKRENLPGARYNKLISVQSGCGKKAAKGACWRETRELAGDQWADGSFQQSLQWRWAVSVFLLLPWYFSVPNVTKRNAVPKETSEYVSSPHLQRTERCFLILMMPQEFLRFIKKN